MPTRVVAQGECISSIAEACGFSWETVWNHPRNAALRQKRSDPNVLNPGDEIFIPDIEVKEVAGATGQVHTFVKRAATAKLSLRLLDADKPRSNVPYTLVVDGDSMAGVTDGDGFVKQVIPARARRGQLTVGEGATKDVFELQFGTVDPVDTEAGVRGRLGNLGFETEKLREAISAFQRKEGLSVTGEADAATRSRLQERFGQ